MCSFTTLLGIGTCLTDPSMGEGPGDWCDKLLVGGVPLCGAKLTTRGVPGAVPTRGVAPTRVVGVSEHRAEVVAKGVVVPQPTTGSGDAKALAVASKPSSGCPAKNAPVEIGSGLVGGWKLEIGVVYGFGKLWSIVGAAYVMEGTSFVVVVKVVANVLAGVNSDVWGAAYIIAGCSAPGFPGTSYLVVGVE